MLLYRREIFSTRWPWLALAVAAPLPAAWMVVRELHNRSSENHHDIVALVRPSTDNLWYYAVVATALVSLVALPLYVAGFVRLLPRAAVDSRPGRKRYSSRFSRWRSSLRSSTAGRTSASSTTSSPSPWPSPPKASP